MDLLNRTQIEDDFLRRANKLSRKHREELKAILGHPPNLDNVPAGFWKRVEEEERRLLIALLLLVGFENAASHGMPKFKAEIKVRQHANLRAEWAATRYTQHSQELLIKNYLELASEYNGQRNIPKTRIDKSVRKVFNPDRNESMISTETTGASVFGAEIAMESQGLISDNDWWMTRPWRTRTGPCKLCESLHKQPRSRWTGINVLAANGPPAHPYCACMVVYVSMGVEWSVDNENAISRGEVRLATA